MVDNFTSSDNGARWVVLEWTFGFDGNSDILSLTVYVTREEEMRILPVPITSQDMNRYIAY